jgi:uncharacterized protein (DUF4415 family)
MTKDKRDTDNPEWTKANFARARPATEVHGAAVAAKLLRKGGRPVLPPETRKQATSIRLSPDVLAALRATGANWQTRADDVLRKAFVSGQ